MDDYLFIDSSSITNLLQSVGAFGKASAMTAEQIQSIVAKDVGRLNTAVDAELAKR